MEKLQQVTISGPKSQLTLTIPGQGSTLSLIVQPNNSTPLTLYTEEGIKVTIPPYTDVQVTANPVKEAYHVEYTPTPECPDYSHHASKMTHDLYAVRYPAQGYVTITNNRNGQVVLRTTLTKSSALQQYVIPFDLINKLN